jgi:hypothetical protein
MLVYIMEEKCVYTYVLQIESQMLRKTVGKFRGWKQRNKNEKWDNRAADKQCVMLLLAVYKHKCNLLYTFIN